MRNMRIVFIQNATILKLTSKHKKKHLVFRTFKRKKIVNLKQKGNYSKNIYLSRANIRED